MELMDYIEEKTAPGAEYDPEECLNISEAIGNTTESNRELITKLAHARPVDDGALGRAISLISCAYWEARAEDDYYAGGL